MNKTEFIELLSKRTALPKSKCDLFLNQFKSTILEVCCKGDNVNLRSFGRFSLQEKKERRFLNPQTKRFYVCPPKKVVTFKSCKAFANAITGEAPKI